MSNIETYVLVSSFLLTITVGINWLLDQFD